MNEIETLVAGAFTISHTKCKKKRPFGGVLGRNFGGLLDFIVWNVAWPFDPSQRPFDPSPPLPKKNVVLPLDNLWPISLLSVVTKIVEKLSFCQFEFFDQKQSGFRVGHSSPLLFLR
jgi:hypothetical protein